MSANETASNAAQPSSTAPVVADTSIVVLPTAPAGESLLVASVELTGAQLGCYREIIRELKASNTPQKFIQKKWVDALPVKVAAQIVTELLAAHHTVPTVLAKHAKSDPESKKLVVKARKDYKRELQRNSRVIVEQAFAQGFSLTSYSRSNTVDSKGRSKLSVVMHTGAGPTAEEKADVLGHLSVEELQAQLAALQAKAENANAIAV